MRMNYTTKIDGSTNLASAMVEAGRKGFEGLINGPDRDQ